MEAVSTSTDCLSVCYQYLRIRGSCNARLTLGCLYAQQAGKAGVTQLLHPCATGLHFHILACMQFIWRFEHRGFLWLQRLAAHRPVRCIRTQSTVVNGWSVHVCFCSC
jgi:hypothetical protein